MPAFWINCCHFFYCCPASYRSAWPVCGGGGFMMSDYSGMLCKLVEPWSDTFHPWVSCHDQINRISHLFMPCRFAKTPWRFWIEESWIGFGLIFANFELWILGFVLIIGSWGVSNLVKNVFAFCFAVVIAEISDCQGRLRWRRSRRHCWNLWAASQSCRPSRSSCNGCMRVSGLNVQSRFKVGSFWFSPIACVHYLICIAFLRNWVNNHGSNNGIEFTQHANKDTIDEARLGLFSSWGWKPKIWQDCVDCRDCLSDCGKCVLRNFFFTVCWFPGLMLVSKTWQPVLDWCSMTPRILLWGLQWGSCFFSFQPMVHNGTMITERISLWPGFRFKEHFQSAT